MNHTACSASTVAIAGSGLGLVAAAPALPRCRFFGRNDRQQEIGLPSAAEMQAGDAAEDGGGTIARIVVQERPATRELVLEVRQLAAARPGIDIILTAHGEADAVAGRNHDRGRPNLDGELDRFALFERLDLVVAVVGPIGRGELIFELSVRGAPPALPVTRVW